MLAEANASVTQTVARAERQTDEMGRYAGRLSTAMCVGLLVLCLQAALWIGLLCPPEIHAAAGGGAVAVLAGTAIWTSVRSAGGDGAQRRRGVSLPVALWLGYVGLMLLVSLPVAAGRARPAVAAAGGSLAAAGLQFAGVAWWRQRRQLRTEAGSRS